MLARSLALIALLATQQAFAGCNPTQIYKRYVGNMAIDALCTDNDIQAAINNAVCPSIIYITNQQAYTAQHLDINNKSLTLVGTTASCGPQTCEGGCPIPTAPEVTISGQGHSGDSVIYIHGNSTVTLKYLRVTGGNNVNGANPTYGGGIHFDGTGSLSLDTSTIDNNTAGFGGGINMNGNGGFAGLALLSNTQIIGNSAANSGGGIRITGNAYLSVLYDLTLIANNHAPVGYGGGINVVGPAHADIGSPGLGLGVIYGNDAKYGGGVAVTASEDGDAEAQIFTVDPLRPVRLQGNFASAKGGAIYLKPYNGFSGLEGARLCAGDFRIDGNGAPEGSAIYADYDTDGLVNTGSQVQLNGTAGCMGFPPSAQYCAAGVDCNLLADNTAINDAGSPTLGATVYISDGSYLGGDRFAMLRNEGGYALLDGRWSRVSNCLLAENDLTRNLVSSKFLEMDSCTLVANTIQSTDTLHVEGPLTLSNTIIDQPGNLALAYSGDAGDLHVEYVLSSDVSTLPAIEGVALGQPSYINAAAHDFHLSLNSLGLDFAPPIVGDDRDLDNLPHDQDLPNVGNLYGVRDLGAYERQLGCAVGDTIFCDGFQAH